MPQSCPRCQVRAGVSVYQFAGHHWLEGSCGETLALPGLVAWGPSRPWRQRGRSLQVEAARSVCLERVSGCNVVRHPQLCLGLVAHSKTQEVVAALIISIIVTIPVPALLVTVVQL